MISYFQAIVLGAVQGLAEFLPISSSAHLILVPWLLKWQDPGLAFDVALHLGTLLALLIYYRDEWIAMARSVAGGQFAERRLLQLLIVASVPGAIIGLAFEKQAETTFRSPLLIAIALAVLAVLLWLFDKLSPQKRTMSEMTYWDAPIIAGAGLVEARKFIREGFDWSVGLGFISAAIFGLIAIAFLIRYVRTRNYVAFAVYRLLVAALVIA